MWRTRSLAETSIVPTSGPSCSQHTARGGRQIMTVRVMCGVTFGRDSHEGRSKPGLRHRNGTYEEAAVRFVRVGVYVRRRARRGASEPATVTAVAGAAPCHHRQPAAASAAGVLLSERTAHGRLAGLRALAKHGLDRRFQQRSSSRAHRASVHRRERSVQVTNRPHVRDRLPGAGSGHAARDSPSNEEIAQRRNSAGYGSLNK